MRFILKGIFLSLIFTISAPLFAADGEANKDWLSFQKNCGDQWDFEQNGHHRHVGKAVCACLADVLTQYKNDHTGEYVNTPEYEIFYKQASQVCTTSGVLANSVNRAIFFNVYDKASIETLCDTSWIGLMGSFQPVNPKFDSSMICRCASPKLTEMVTNYDSLSPKDVRIKSLEQVKLCDSTANLSPKEFSALDEVKKEPVPAGAPSDKGKFSLEIKDDSNPDYNNIAKYLREDGRLQQIVAAMNQNLKIPYDIKVIVTVTGRGPYYISDQKTIFLDYKMMQIETKLYDKFHPDETKENRHHYFNNVNRFLFYHELGHALIDAYHLPVLGQEEDAADAFAAVISLKYLPQGYQVLVDAADFFYQLDKVVGTDTSDYWDEHGLNKQRYYRLLCFAYGKVPGQVVEKIKHYYQGALNTFIKERSDYCHYGYNDTYFSWMLLLQPYLKPVPAVEGEKSKQSL